ncbi:MAG: 50S ribosomal protein L11 methyltransferase [Gammaproteobacteria bacterium]
MTKCDSASFHDPAGHVYWHEGEVYRTVMPCFAEAFETVRQSGAVEHWIKQQILWPEQVVSTQDLDFARHAYTLLKHPRLPFISYPYEWPFALLKEAALFHLDLMLDAISQDIMLNDASAFNVQFNGVKPIFIDHLAFRPYIAGEFWQAHKQFFEQFVNPLLLQAYRGTPFQPWYRGTLNGIATNDIAALLPWRRKWNWQVFCHVVMQAHFDKAQRQQVAKAAKQVQMPKQGLQHLWRSLRKWIDGLHDSVATSHWQSYANTHSYDDEAFSVKQEFIKRFITQIQPDLVWDLGCNTGVFSRMALNAGAKRVIGFDNDHSALQVAFETAKKDNLLFTPLFTDLINPTPAQGWHLTERMSFTQRQQPNAILALAVVHHLAISANVPLPLIVDWLTEMAPAGVIEFIPKSDPMVQSMLSQRADIFTEYLLASFIDLLSQKVRIVSRVSVNEGGRELVWFVK